jgi:5-methylcytosine-specific restriction endonuclease McrA
MDINPSTLISRIKLGQTLEEALENEPKKICPICEKEFTAKNRATKYCSKTCRERARKGKGKYKKIPITCVVCGKEFVTDREDRKTCSRACRLARDRISRNSRYDELKERGEFDESVTLINVYNAFKGKCQACGKELSFETGWLENDYPSIDHIKPLAKGGTHTWDNVQLLCRGCNCKKSDKYLEKIGIKCQ